MFARKILQARAHYRFDVQALASVEHAELRSHIQRVGLELYRVDASRPAPQREL